MGAGVCPSHPERSLLGIKLSRIGKVLGECWGWGGGREDNFLKAGLLCSKPPPRGSVVGFCGEMAFWPTSSVSHDSNRILLIVPFSKSSGLGPELKIPLSIQMWWEYLTIAEMSMCSFFYPHSLSGVSGPVSGILAGT